MNEFPPQILHLVVKMTRTHQTVYFCECVREREGGGGGGGGEGENKEREHKNRTLSPVLNATFVYLTTPGLRTPH